MRLGWRTVGLATLLIPAALSSGCSGVNATGTVSPLMFLVPGLGQTGPTAEPSPAAPPATSTEPVQILAQAP
jgi:type IV secretory pathway TrbF-like protein